jgi:hypothetical protein
MEGCDRLCSCTPYNYIINSMEQRPSGKVNRLFASQEIPRILLNPMVHYHILKHPPPVLIPSQISPVHFPVQLIVRSISILPSYLPLGLPSCLFSSSFLTKTLYAFLLCSRHATCPTHLILFYLITQIILGEEYRS